MEIVIGLAGGLALFLFGIEQMSEGLQQAAGRRLSNVLSFLTKNTFVGVLSGLILTMLIQSSSATTVMLVGFVKAGLMTLQQTIGPILGANIGTTITAQMVSLKLTDLALPAVALGFVLYFGGKSRRWKLIGESILGFGLLFHGMELMSTSLEPLRNSAVFADIIAQFAQHPLLGVLIGIIGTAIVQSSSAFTAVVLALAMQDLVTLESGVALVLGSNIGTCVTALLASIGGGVTALRVAVAHLLFNTVGVVLFLLIFNPFTSLVSLTSPVVARQLANSHTLFNVANTLLFLPFVGVFVKFLERIIPGEDEIVERRVKYLDVSALKYPRVSLELAAKEINRMATYTEAMLSGARKAFLEGNRDSIYKVQQSEDLVDMLQEEILEYMSSLLTSNINLSNVESERATGLMMVVNDIERIADHANNIAEFAQVMMDDELKFSEEATAQLTKMFDLVQEMVRLSVQVLANQDKEAAQKIWDIERLVDEMEEEMRQGHMKRMYEGVCIPRAGIVYVEMVTNLERIGDHTTNIADMVLTDQLPASK